MVKNKSKDYRKAGEQENQESSSEESSAESGMTDVQSQPPLPQQEQTESKDNGCNKRKALEEGFTPKRTRPRCSSLTAFSDLWSKDNVLFWFLFFSPFVLLITYMQLDNTWEM